MTPDAIDPRVALAGLLALRVFAIMRVQPLWRTIVGPWWWAVAAAIAVATAFTAAPSGLRAPFSVPDWLGLAVLEFLLGSVVGLLVALPGFALLGAATTGSLVLGLRGAASRGLVGLSITLVLGFGAQLGLHRPLLASLFAITVSWPVGDPQAWTWSSTDVLVHATTAAHAMAVLALALATPVLLAAAVVDVGLRLLGRGPVPSETITDALAPWARTAAALIALGASWASYPEAWTRALG